MYSESCWEAFASRSTMSICQHYGIEESELEGKLLIRSGYDYAAVLAENDGNKSVLASGHTKELIKLSLDKEVGLVVIDPYVSIHEVDENDNVQQNGVFKILRAVCAATNAAMLVVAHTRKAGNNEKPAYGDVESLRGASAIKDAARSAITLSPMPKSYAEKHGIDWTIGIALRRIDDAKSNFSLMNDHAVWIKMQSVKLANGDFVGVATSVEINDYMNDVDICPQPLP
ncbi:hypothetical protein LCGC14_2409000 [marine sediment metagenome]|uniref:SF4 helicase domain-containing protein n=1 Tax=marine sediment metagenome TaxID=412755 RepID=A0A0F9BT47_9ZZZZ|nr:hypothetical protein [Porticoccus sp.]